MYKFSIIIPVYNEAERIERCIKSILNNKYESIEIIVIDDNSSDDSVEIICRLQKTFSNIFLYQNSSRKGAGYCRNLGIKKARGEYLWFVDGDDYIQKNSIDILIKYIEEKEIEILCFDIKRIDNNDKFVYNLLEQSVEEITSGKELYCRFSRRNYVRASACTQIYSKNYIEEKKLFFREGVMGEDACFSMYAMINATRTIYIKNALYIYHKSENSVTTSTKNRDRFIGIFLAYCDMIHFCYLKNVSNELDECIAKFIIKYYKLAASYFSYEMKSEIDKYIDSQEDYVKKLYNLFIESEYGENYISKLSKEKIDIIKQNDNVIVYGAGVVAKQLVILLNKLEKRILAYAVSDIKNNPNNIYGVPVVKIDDLIEYKENVLIVIATASNKSTEIKNLLLKLEFNNILQLFE